MSATTGGDGGAASLVLKYPDVQLVQVWCTGGCWWMLMGGNIMRKQAWKHNGKVYECTVSWTWHATSKISNIDLTSEGAPRIHVRQVEIDEMVIQTSQQFFPSFSSAFGRPGSSDAGS